MANDKFPLIVNPADVTGTALSKVVQLQPSDKLSPDALPTMVGDSGSGGTAGIVPAPAAGDAAAGKYLDADGTWTVPPGGGGGSGDVTGPGTSTDGFIPKWSGTGGDTLAAGVAAPTGAIVGTSDAQTLTNKTLTAPTVADFTNAGHTHQNGAGGGTLDAAAIGSGTIATARLGSGTANSSTFLRGDQTYATPAGGGDVSGPGSSTAGNVPTYADTSGTELDGGFPVSAAAKTVLDDASVSAMVDTLGGASSTGTGGLVRATSPTLVTPALGTPSAAVLTNATGLPVGALVGAVAIANGGTGQTGQTAAFDALSPTTTKGDLLVDDGTNVVRRGVGTNGQVLTADSAEATGVKWANPAGGGDALTSGTLAQFAATTSAELRGVLSDETGTGAAVFATSPTLVTPLLGTPTSGTLTNCAGLPTGGVTVSATDRLLGRVSASGGVAEEIPITDFVQTILDDADAAAVRTTIGAGTGNGDALTSGHLGQFAATTSAQLAGVLSDETGSGAAVFATSPTLVTPALGTPSAVVLTNATGLPTAGLVDGAVTDAKLADMSGFAVKAKPTTGTGDPSEVVLGASDLLGRIESGDVQGITLADLTEEGAPAAGDFLAGWIASGELRKFDVGDLPAGTPADDSITNAKLADMTAQAIKANPTGSSADPQDLAIAEARIVGRLTGGNVAGLTAAEVVTLTGAEVTSNKNVASGYAGLDALIQVPTARQRPREWDQIEYGWRKTPGLGLVEPRGVGFPYMFDGELTDAPGNGGSWVLVDSGASTHGGLQTAFNVIQTRWSPDLSFLIKTGASLTGHRFWIGIAAAYIDATAPVADGGTFSIASACFTWDATVHSASNFWRAHTSDGSGAAGATVTTTGTAIAVDTEYDLRIKANPGSNILFYINDSLVATHTTDLPSTSTAYGIVMRVVGTDKTFLFKRAVVLHD